MASLELIPPEIWVQIFGLATEDRGSSLERLQVGPNEHGWKENVSYRESLKTKLALVQTCRQWNIMATPLFYEHISITNESQHKRVLKAFRGGPSERHKGLITRLDVVCPEKGKALKILVDLCRLFGDVETVVASLGFHNEDEPSALLAALSPNLRHLYLLSEGSMWSVTKIPVSLLVDFLEKHSQLADISIPFIFHKDPEENNIDPTWRSKRWPSLKTLVMQNQSQAEAISSYLPGRAFPNIQTINGSWMGSGDSEEFRSFLSTHTGQGILRLSFSIGGWHIVQLSNLLQNLSSLCPSLREVHVWLEEHVQPVLFGKLSGKAPHVTTIGLHRHAGTRGYRVPNANHAISELHSLAAFPWTKPFPNLSTIRLMERVDFDSYRELDEVTRMGLRSPGRYVRNSIRVEDQDGRFLAQFTPGISTLVEL